MEKKTIKFRIDILDGFRTLAILSVMLFHYFSRWTPPQNQKSLYPYNGKYNFFIHGNLGVQFFFIISGFVIFFTLENTSHFSLFWKKRLIRLFPAMVFASILTYIVCSFFDKYNLFPNSHVAKNILISITFIRPSLISNFVNYPGLEYISGAYWSLWLEIQFYVFASILFYLNKQKFVRHFFFAAFTLIFLNYVFQNIQDSSPLKIELPNKILILYSIWFTNTFNLVIYLPFFTLGMFFYLLYKNKNNNAPTSVVIKICLATLILSILYSGIELQVRLIYLLMILLFFSFIYFPKILSFLENKTMTNIGKSSYFLYLIHENLGVLCIYSFGGYFLPFGFILTLLVIFSLIFLSIFFTKKIDNKIQKALSGNNAYLKLKKLNSKKIF